MYGVGRSWDSQRSTDYPKIIDVSDVIIDKIVNRWNIIIKIIQSKWFKNEHYLQNKKSITSVGGCRLELSLFDYYSKNNDKCNAM